ncbi:uncharacterized protein LOC141617026 [Silene latifolia]|uniref:uncharacterized protein LOC141617026 n=1 Tax=Silene latifolia TaxID=37657 RepID=UPI003D789F67
MHAQPQPLELDQRQQIFRTRFTIRGRVCNLIIDGGSCINVASKTLIEKLNLDEVMCDVLSMDACHLLLGRPWKFDRDCVHQGRENTYSFKLGKKKITLTPFPPTLKYTTPPSLVEHSEDVLMIGESETIQELNSKEVILILLAKGVAEEAWLPLPAEIQQLLRNYGDVFPAELPSGLPRLRG